MKVDPPSYTEFLAWLESLPNDFTFKLPEDKGWAQCCPAATHAGQVYGGDERCAAHGQVIWYTGDELVAHYYETPQWMSVFMCTIDVQMHDRQITKRQALDALLQVEHLSQ